MFGRAPTDRLKNSNNNTSKLPRSVKVPKTELSSMNIVSESADKENKKNSHPDAQQVLKSCLKSSKKSAPKTVSFPFNSSPITTTSSSLNQTNFNLTPVKMKAKVGSEIKQDENRTPLQRVDINSTPTKSLLDLSNRKKLQGKPLRLAVVSRYYFYILGINHQ
jgi:hypothetical protein